MPVLSSQLGEDTRDVYRVDYSSSDLTLNFGTACPIFNRSSMTLYITNPSLIEADFDLTFERYPTWQFQQGQRARDDDSEGGKEDSTAFGSGGRERLGHHALGLSTSTLLSLNKEAQVAVGLHRTASVMNGMIPGTAEHHVPVKSSDDESKEQMRSATTRSSKAVRRPILKSSITNQQRFHSAIGITYSSVVKQSRHAGLHDQEILQNGSGAAFMAVPDRGKLKPRSRVCIQITGYNNLCGLYHDQLIVNIDQWLRRSIPVTMGVVGSPLKFVGRSLAAAEGTDGGPCRINFGTRVLNNHLSTEAMSLDVNGLVTKVIQIENQSPKSIALDWRVYSVNSTAINGAGTNGGISGGTDLGSILQKENTIEDGVAPFNIFPRTMLLGAFQTQPISISFGSPIVGTFAGGICAGVQIREKDGTAWANAHDAATRPGSASIDKIQLAKVPVLLRVHGKSIVPKMTLDCGDRIRLKVRRNLQIVAQLQQQQHQQQLLGIQHSSSAGELALLPTVSRIINLSNTTDSEFGFAVHTSSPCFRAILNLSPEQVKRFRRHRAGQKEGAPVLSNEKHNECELLPKEHTVMTICFDSSVYSKSLERESPPLMALFDGNERAEGLPTTDMEAASPSNPVVHGELLIVFTNGTQQVVPLLAEIRFAL